MLQHIQDCFPQSRIWLCLPALQLISHPLVEFFHRRSAMGLMISQSHQRRQLFLFSGLIVFINLSQFLNNIAALLREAFCKIDEVPAGMARQLANMVSNSLDVFRDRASHIWMGGPMVLSLCPSRLVRFSPA